ncbi:hypothetical protein ILYODFUR_002190 [Ilyodon furcidens]|uniref:Uncharacterized protein n=1 Tax=Ilyodon furcidens TaxID=33524 RepID=A0ABV0V1M9_9TELE
MARICVCMGYRGVGLRCELLLFVPAVEVILLLCQTRILLRVGGRSPVGSQVFQTIPNSRSFSMREAFLYLLTVASVCCFDLLGQFVRTIHKLKDKTNINRAARWRSW